MLLSEHSPGDYAVPCIADPMLDIIPVRRSQTPVSQKLRSESSPRPLCGAPQVRKKRTAGACQQFGRRRLPILQSTRSRLLSVLDAFTAAGRRSGSGGVQPPSGIYLSRRQAAKKGDTPCLRICGPEAMSSAMRRLKVDPKVPSNESPCESRCTSCTAPTPARSPCSG